MVFWAEGNALVHKQDEAAILAQGSELAAKDQVYLGMALAVLNPGQKRPVENKFVVAAPDSKIHMDYYKAHPVPGGEEAMSVTKDGCLQILETPFGHVSAVICFDSGRRSKVRHGSRPVQRLAIDRSLAHPDDKLSCHRAGESISIVKPATVSLPRLIIRAAPLRQWTTSIRAITS
jgi:hypothetical protein